jgi:hypothetical protein
MTVSSGSVRKMTEATDTFGSSDIVIVPETDQSLSTGAPAGPTVTEYETVVLSPFFSVTLVLLARFSIFQLCVRFSEGFAVISTVHAAAEETARSATPAVAHSTSSLRFVRSIPFPLPSRTPVTPPVGGRTHDVTEEAVAPPTFG